MRAGVRERLAHDGHDGKGDRARKAFGLEGERADDPREFPDQLGQGGLWIEGLVVQVVHAGPHGAEGLVEGGADRRQLFGERRIVLVRDGERLHLQHRAGEQVADVVVDLPRDAGSLGQHRAAHFQILPLGEVASALGQGEAVFLHGVAPLAERGALGLNFGRAPGGQAGERSQQKGGCRQRAASGHCGAQEGRGP